jgi:hypothetical protein
MAKELYQSRRQFIRASSLCGVTALLPGFINGWNHHRNIESYSEALIKVINDWNLPHGLGIHPDGVKNIKYAFEVLKPEDHQDLAFIVATCGFTPMKHLIDEYKRRKNGQRSLYPDHPVLELTEYGVPNTYRIIVYDEQLEALFQEIIQDASKEKIWEDLWFNKNKSRIDLRKCLLEPYRSELSDCEVRNIWDAMNYFRLKWIPSYTFCSTIVNRASELISHDYTI